MIFIYKNWDFFCRQLAEKGHYSIPTREIIPSNPHYVVLKHDVETNVQKAYQLAKIENKYGHKGSFYVQAYLMHNQENIIMLREMQEMGHEISYHYDVMDSCQGDLDKAIQEFHSNIELFERNGFLIQTVCQHGNPIVVRKGYTSNRDFFRSEKVRRIYPLICDVMVNLKSDIPTEFDYYSDAGRVFKRIYDPLNNDVVNSDDKNVSFKDLSTLLEALNYQNGNIISNHPHRWCRSGLIYLIKASTFKIIRATAKFAANNPLAKRIMNRYYYLAKKF